MSGRRTRDDRGGATAEFAMIMPALVVLIVIVVGSAAIGLTSLRAFDAARAAAREAARGEPAAAVVREAEERAGTGAEVVITEDRGYTSVEVTIVVPDVLRFISPDVTGTATARTEGGQ